MKRQERQLWVFSGENDWPLHAAEQAGFNLGRQGRMGSTLANVLFDARQGFDVNKFAQAVGSLQGGANIALLTPPFDEWSDMEDKQACRWLSYPHTYQSLSGHFIRRLTESFNHPNVRVFRSNDEIARVPQSLWVAKTTPEQKQALTIIKAHLTQSSPCPVVLTADRGRGKTTLLGMLAVEQLQEGKTIRLVAGNRTQVKSAFDYTSKKLARRDCAGKLNYGQGLMAYHGLDYLLSTCPDADVVCVDEAASLPLYLLERLISMYPKVVLSTTVHGYEGTGRAFELRLKPRLESQGGYLAVNLKSPIRYADNDGLEAWLNQVLVLNFNLPVISTSDAKQTIREISQEELAADEWLLQQCWSLLINAHYRTRPSDLRNLLDLPDMRLWVVMRNNSPVSLAITQFEGGMKGEVLQDVFLGIRRPNGHLVAQSLSAHAGLIKAPSFKYWRVVRIATHPEYQRQGLASTLLSKIYDEAKRENIDLLSTSFGRHMSLECFWLESDFKAVREGIMPDEVTGEKPLMMLKALSIEGQELLFQAQAIFKQQLTQEQFLLDIYSYTQGYRQLESCLPAITQLMELTNLFHLAQNRADNSGEETLLTISEQKLLSLKLIQKKSWPAAAKAAGFNGKKAAQKQMRNLIHEIMLSYETNYQSQVATIFARDT